MKKLVSLLCVLAMIAGICAVSVVGANAADPAKTALDVEKGDEVTYVLQLSGVELPVIGIDFSIYYDSSLLSLDSFADYSGKTSEDDWIYVVNTGLDGEVKANYAQLSGIDFNEKHDFATLKLKATDSGTAHISYYIRYMYDSNIFNSDDSPQIVDYKFECNVDVNGKEVLENAQPELNLEKEQKQGLFVNSVTGDSKDADADVPGAVVKKNNTNSGVSGGNSNNGSGGNDGGNSGGNSGGNGGGNSGANNGGGSGEVQEDEETAAPPATTADGYFITATDADGNVTATSDEAPVVTTTGNSKKGGSSPVIWIIIAVVVLAGGGAAAFFFMKKQSAAAEPVSTAPDADAPAASDSDADASAAADSDPDKTVAADSDPDKTVAADPEDK